MFELEGPIPNVDDHSAANGMTAVSLHESVLRHFLDALGDREGVFPDTVEAISKILDTTSSPSRNTIVAAVADAGAADEAKGAA